MRFRDDQKTSTQTAGTFGSIERRIGYTRLSMELNGDGRLKMGETTSSGILRGLLIHHTAHWTPNRLNHSAFVPRMIPESVGPL